MSAPTIPEKRRSFWTLFLLIFPVLFLSSLGILILISAGASRADPYILAKKQAIWLIIATFVGLGAIFINLETLRKLSIPIAIVSFIMLLLVLVPQIGKEVNGARRWLEFGSIVIQPSDLAKFALVICLSSGKYQAAPNDFPRGTIVTFTKGAAYGNIQLTVACPAS